MGKIRLSALLGDRMVLQRETENSIWGYAEPGRTIQLKMGEYQAGGETGADGSFEFLLPPMKKGGPWEISLEDGENRIVIRDVLFGDVFLLGGQSNMELPVARTLERFETEIRTTEEPEIRLFEVPKEYLFGEKREEIYQGSWWKAKGEELLLFSAAGYFAAKELHEKEQVPIGLLQTAVGGTPVKTWCSEETIRRLGLDVEELEQCKQTGYSKEIETEEAERAERWWKEALHPEAEEEGLAETDGPDGIPEKGKSAAAVHSGGSIRIPGFFEGTSLSGFHGGLRLKRSIWLSEEKDWGRQEAKLYLGALVDADITYINGVKVGETAYRYPPRIYQVPAGILHGGENILEIEMLVFGDGGGFMPGKAYELRFGETEVMDLSGEWDYEVIRQMEELPETTFFIYKSAGLYQGMLYPLRRWNLKGCFFYQGESNTGRTETYQEELTAMIADWRALWKREELPFLYVQLAGFSDGKEHTEGTDWAKLREAQRKTGNVPDTMMVQAYDLGEYNDLHPTDKKSVGIRLALAAEKLIYGREVLCRGAEVREVLWKEEEAVVRFLPETTVLHAVEKKGSLPEAWKQAEVKGFEVIFSDGSRSAAGAVLASPETVRVRLPKQKEVAGICYAWNDCPLEANLYNEAELPVVPFEAYK